jgi:2-polyprenyl-6-methoxyphenol hydroxylase-like FAD-dependent oxidoreductase
MTNSTSPSQAPVLVAGGGIGGMACALALAREGLPVELFEQSPEIGEIGAGLQLGPNAFAALDALGVGEQIRRAAVFTDRMVMMDAVDCSEVASIPVGDDFRARFCNPYAVTHRADLHAALHAAAVAHPLVRIHVGTRIASVERTEGSAEVRTTDGQRFAGAALVGCDGVKSIVRDRLVGDTARVSGHVVYRAVVPAAAMPRDMQWNAPVVWAGPNCHLVHYPLRGGEQYNLVVTFHSREPEQWGVTDGSKEEVMSYFGGIHDGPRRLLDLPRTWRRWSTADRDPVARWSEGHATLLGDAAHPMMQYLAQGACMALEDAVTLGAAAKACRASDGEVDWPEAFRRYESARVARTARVVLSVREFGRLCHATGVERLVRNSLWAGRRPERFYDALEWIYAWTPEHCLNQNTQNTQDSQRPEAAHEEAALSH